MFHPFFIFCIQEYNSHQSILNNIVGKCYRTSVLIYFSFTCHGEQVTEKVQKKSSARKMHIYIYTSSFTAALTDSMTTTVFMYVSRVEFIEFVLSSYFQKKTSLTIFKCSKIVLNVQLNACQKTASPRDCKNIA